MNCQLQNATMKTKKNFLIPTLLFLVIMCSACSNNDPLLEKKLHNVSATIVKGCFDFSRPDTFSIELENYPEGIFAIYPAERIPEEFRVDGLNVLISGDISNEKETNQCFISPGVKLTGTNLIKITNIQKKK